MNITQRQVLIYSYSNREAAEQSRTSLQTVGGDAAKQSPHFSTSGATLVCDSCELGPALSAHCDFYDLSTIIL